MTTFAVIDNNIVENIAIADSKEVLELLLPDKTIIEETESTGVAWVGAEVISGKFKAPQPFESWTWDKKAFAWVAPEPKPTTEPEGFWEWDESSLTWIDRVFVISDKTNE